MTVMHRPFISNKLANSPNHHPTRPSDNNQSNLCTEVCNSHSTSTCSKVVLVDITLPSKSNLSLRCFCIVDEQSSSSFIDPKVLDFFGSSFPIQEYTLSTLTGLKTTTTGRLVSGFKVKGVNEKRTISLPPMFTNPHIPDCRLEIASPEVVRSHKRISKFAKHFPAIDPSAEVMLLVGRDCGPAMATKCYGYQTPYVHHTTLGWALVGSVCLNSQRRADKVILRIHVELEPSISTPCFTSNPAVGKKGLFYL